MCKVNVKQSKGTEENRFSLLEKKIDRKIKNLLVNGHDLARFFPEHFCILKYFISLDNQIYAYINNIEKQNKN